MRTKLEQHSWRWAVLLMGWLSGLLGPGLLAQPGGDTGGGSSTNGIPEAPTNGLYYARLNAAWKDFAPGLYSMQTDAPEGGGYFARSDLEWKLIQSTVTGGTLDILSASIAEFQPPGFDGTTVSNRTSAFIRFNHLYNPDGLITAFDQTNRTFRIQTGRYAVTINIPVCVTGSVGGNNRMPFTVGLWDLSALTNIYYSTFTLYDDEKSQVTTITMPIFDARGDRDYAIRVQNLDDQLPVVCGLDTAGSITNRYSEVMFLKLSGAVTLPATQWAVENLLVNTALEVGTVGQAIGYTALGEVGVVSLGSGGGGADPNAVANFPDLATLTNSVPGYTKAMVGTGTSQALYELTGVVIPLNVPTNGTLLVGVPLANPAVITITNNVITSTHASNPQAALGVYVTGAATIGQEYTSYCDVRGTHPGVIATDTSTWTSHTANTPLGVSSDWSFVSVSFVAGVVDAFRTYENVTTPTAGQQFYLRDWRYIVGPWQEIVNGWNVFPSTVDGYGWKRVGDIYPDALADGQTYGRKDGAWAVVTGGAVEPLTITVASASYTTTIPANAGTVVIRSLLGETTISFDAQPTIAAGDFIGQKITLVAHYESTGTLEFFDRNLTGHEGSLLDLKGVSSNGMNADEVGQATMDLVWNGLSWMQTIGPGITLVEATLLPAPWGPPDEDGNQTIRDDVQDALIDALLPRLLQRLGLSAGTLPTPTPAPRRRGAPGTRANPIDWPAPAEPATEPAGKYNVTIKIGDH